MKIGLKTTPINNKFWNDLMDKYQSFIEIQAKIVLIGGKMIKSIVNYTLNFVERYRENFGAAPLRVHSCSIYDSVISSESLVDLMVSGKSGSSYK